jgi:hypothetical protein
MNRCVQSLVLLACLVATGGIGCATAFRPAAETGHPSRWEQSKHGLAAAEEAEAMPASASASALVFRPPVAAYGPPIDLSRAPRQPSAFIGFEGPITEYYHVLTIDRQISGGGYTYPSGSGWGCGVGGGYLDRYERRAVIEKVGVLRR